MMTLIVVSPSAYSQMGDSQIKRAQIFIENSDFESAVKILENIASKGNADIDVFYLLGLSYRGLKDYPKAEQAFRMVLNKDSKCEPGYIQLTAVQIEMNHLADAEKTVGQFLRLSPKSAQAHYAAGVIFYAQKDTLKAIREFKEATLCDTKYSPAYGNLAVAYYNRGQYKEALENFEKAANFDPLSPRYLFFAGWTSRTLGNKERAASYFRRSSNIKAPSAYSVTWKIIQAYDSKDIAKVNECLKELSFIDSEFDKGYYFKGLLFIDEKKFSEAEECFKKMLEQDPLDRDALDMINKLKKMKEEQPEPTESPSPTPSASPAPSVSPTPEKSDNNEDGKEKKEEKSDKPGYDLGIPIPKPDSEKEK
jgi:tetratricopeptide (TPR) repeat protein